MGLFYSRFFSGFPTCNDRATQLVMLGLDHGGKTTALYQLKLHSKIQTFTTIGCNVETIRCRSQSLTIWDIAGHEPLRSMWRTYFENSMSIIYVVDSTDILRIDEAKEELWRALRELSEMSDAQTDAALLVYANKQDHKDAMTVAEVRDALELDRLQGRVWHIQGSDATTGMGLVDGLDWLSAQQRRSAAVA
ncbi:hypothetical protein BG011_008281 [Mortierella polycephala]|uniref:ADP-ribosylation factor n=1 Tax=Mortierella polycephala TaxID=41804 RepID=A0A9P6TXK8_9FUNG|nr:hypothetical protein BG011_008281 [Mortierella polycephala]